MIDIYQNNTKKVEKHKESETRVIERTIVCGRSVSLSCLEKVKQIGVLTKEEMRRKTKTNYPKTKQPKALLQILFTDQILLESGKVWSLANGNLKKRSTYSGRRT
ncbi:hypothetical protein M0812_25102 [Anaeramoeba flamelloides]|uniref:Uncharacterized protein n=1 Tax=Anaeramoeba flamelloides TaxID=1746091 RepID=A0AAV7YM55_9EUKA|nr:hypothetical protein M0812_25102 [Anaeramoeba flamelloides]